MSITRYMPWAPWPRLHPLTPLQMTTICTLGSTFLYAQTRKPTSSPRRLPPLRPLSRTRSLPHSPTNLPSSLIYPMYHSKSPLFLRRVFRTIHRRSSHCLPSASSLWQCMVIYPLRLTFHTPQGPQQPLTHSLLREKPLIRTLRPQVLLQVPSDKGRVPSSLLNESSSL